MRISPSTDPCTRPGFTLTELTVASGMMVFLAYLLCQTWSGLGRPTAELASRSRITQEAKLAVASLGHDLGGSLSNQEGRIGSKDLLKFVGRIQPGNNQLWLCFDGGTNPNGVADWGPPDTVIVYQVQDNSLLRWDQTVNTTCTIARHVEAFQLQDLGDTVRITLTFQFRQVTRTYTLVARNP